MGRVAGVSRHRNPRAAAARGRRRVAQQGYDGTRVADIARQPGVSNGALYAHFGSKAELLVGALRAHGRRHLADMFEADPDRPVTEMLLAIGQRLAVSPMPAATSWSRRWWRPAGTRMWPGPCATTWGSGLSG